MIKQWVFEERFAEDKISTLSKSINVNAYLAEILLQRGIGSYEQAKNFFRPSWDSLHDPFLMADLPKAVNRVSEAVFNKEKILIYGDYDVDGTTAVSVMYGFLRDYTTELDFYIPDRYKEGYGISKKGIRWAAENGFRMVIALDCGIKAMDEALLAKDLGIDLIVCDHHLPGPQLPEAYAVLDPKREDCAYPYKELSGCAVGFKLLQGFCIQNTINIHRLFDFLDLVAVSIASDIVPITGENRLLAYYGLKKINMDPNPGIKALIEVAGFKKNLSITNVVFGIGPRINAAGRIGHGKEAVKLLMSKNLEEAEVQASKIDLRNTARKEFDQNITAEAIELIEENPVDAKSTVLFKNDWHKGVIGIVASRCIEKYYRPTIILTESNNKATGSARSVDGFDVYEAISECADLLDQYGGHKYAAGLTMAIDKIEEFRGRFEEVVSRKISPEQLIPKVNIDLEIPLEVVSFKFLNVIHQMTPFGPGNMEPVFASGNLKLSKPALLLKGEHIKMQVVSQEGKGTIEAMAFGFGYLYDELTSTASFDLAYHVEMNEYMGNKSLFLNVRDIKINKG